MADWDEFEEFRRRAFSSSGDRQRLAVQVKHPHTTHPSPIQQTHIGEDSRCDDDDDDDDDGCNKDIDLLDRMAKLKLRETSRRESARRFWSPQRELRKSSVDPYLSDGTSSSHRPSPQPSTPPHVSDGAMPSYRASTQPSTPPHVSDGAMPSYRASTQASTPPHVSDGSMSSYRASTPPHIGRLRASHHKRSSSCRQRPAQRPHVLDLSLDAPTRRRTYSMPSRNKYQMARKQALLNAHQDRTPISGSDPDSECVHVRTFSTSSKGITSRGSSFKRRGELYSNISQMMLADAADEDFRPRTWSGTSQGSSVCSASSSLSPRHYTVAVLGTCGVGKTSIIRRFMASEYGADTSFDEMESVSVPVLVDGDESLLEFVEHRPTNNPEDIPVGDAYVVVFSIAQQESFDDAVDFLFELRKHKVQEKQAVVMVGNKRDIVRQREVSEEDAKIMATRYDVKYIEVSTILNHQLDDLLAGIVKQIRLKEIHQPKVKATKKSRHEGSPGQLCSAREIVRKIFKRDQISRSCDNLFVS